MMTNLLNLNIQNGGNLKKDIYFDKDIWVSDSSNSDNKTSMVKKNKTKNKKFNENLVKVIEELEVLLKK